MKNSLLLIGIVTLTAWSGPVRPATASPKDIVQQFVEMDVEGMRVTPEGWHEADALFAEASKPSQPKALVVIAKRYAISEAPDKGDKTQFLFGYEEVGRIDAASTRFTPTKNAVMWEFDKYTLVLTNAHRTVRSDKEPKATEVGAVQEWRIDGVQPAEMHLTADAAMRYVAQMRDKTTDQILRKNAEATLSRLKAFR